jgi:3'-phosphoadenosine 5'-phosphosulfate sulfotransferase (PAPS reductase)/FAD synthetase
MFVVLEQGRQRNPYTKPYEPEWRSEPGLTETQRKKQRALRSMWKKESKKRGKHVDAQPEIEKLRDMRHPDGSPRALFAVSHSGGKDSQAMLTQVRKVIPDDQIVLVHAPLHGVEWDGIVDQVERYADGLPIIYAPAQDKQGDEKWLLERVLERGMWPSTGQRWCTSDFKRGPIRREVRRYADSKGFDIIVEGLGLRAQESDARGFRPALAPLKAEDGKIKATAPRWRRRWYHWHPIKWMTTDQVFRTIKDAKQEPFWTYAEGMTRASCAFCIMASSSDLAVAARLAPDLYAQYVAVEKVIGHTLDQQGRPLEEVTGTPADPELVRKYVRKIMKTGELRDITEAGQRPKKRKRPRRRGSVRLPVVRGGQLPLMNPARTINERLGLLHYPVGIDTEYLVLYDVELAFRDIDSAVVGAMLIGGTDDEGYRQVVMSAAERGWGPALYTAAMDRVRPLALVPDRHYGRVTPEAHRLYVRFGSGTDVKQVSIPDDLKVHGDPTLDAGYTLSPTSSGARILTEHVEAAEELGDAFVSQYSAREGYDRAATHTLLVEAADSFMRSRIRA